MQLLCADAGMGAAGSALRAVWAAARALPVGPAGALSELLPWRHAGAGAADPLAANSALMLAMALASWLFFLATGNCSHVDRLWSVLPPLYALVFAWQDMRGAAASLLGAGEGSHSPEWDARVAAAAALVVVWGCRLTYNFWRKGGYRLSFEDHRWAEVRTLMPPWLFHLFNLAFVAFAQHALCLLITTPLYARRAAAAVAAAAAGAAGAAGGGAAAASPHLGWGGAAALCAGLLFLCGEALADQQQWAFQREKQRLLAARAPRRGDHARGFLTRGLFRYSRHPAFFCEYSFWWSIYVLAGALPTRCALLLPWVAGPVGLTLLFHAGSVWITERLSCRRYPDYQLYRAATRALVPGPPRGPPLPDRTA